MASDFPLVRLSESVCVSASLPSPKFGSTKAGASSTFERRPKFLHRPNKALEFVGVHGFAIPVLQWWRRDSSRVASREAGRPRRLEHSCRGCQDGLVTYGVGWLQRHLAAGRRHQHSCDSRSGDLPTTSASTHTCSHPQSRRISPAYLQHAFRTRGERMVAPI